MMVGGGILIPFLGLFVADFELLLVPYNIILFVVVFVSSMVARKHARTLTFTRRTDPVLSNRAMNRISVSLFNEGSNSLRVRFRDGAPENFEQVDNDFEVTLGPRDEFQGAYHVRPSERGTVLFEDPYIRILAPLGLCEVAVRLPGEEEVHVYPNVLALRDFDLLKQRGRLAQAGARRSRYKAQGTEFESLREYANDSYRLIDWKSTARRGKLMVREYTTERNQPVIVCLDCGRGMLSEIGGVTKLDMAMDASLLLVHAAANAGDLVGIMSFDHVVRNVHLPRKGRAQMGRILQSLHGLTATPLSTNYMGAFLHLAGRQKRRSLIVVMTDAEDAYQAAELTKALAPLTRRHLVFVVRITDPGIQALKSQEVTDRRAMFDRAAAIWYDGERRAATAKLRAAAVQNIEAEPQDLGAALVSAYLVAKERVAI